MDKTLGNGWFFKMDEHYTFTFSHFMPPNPNPYKPFGKYLVLTLDMKITYTDGTMEMIRTDDAFKVKEHPVVMSNVYGSETIDGRRNQDGWRQGTILRTGRRHWFLMSRRNRKENSWNSFSLP